MGGWWSFLVVGEDGGRGEFFSGGGNFLEIFISVEIFGFLMEIFGFVSVRIFLVSF